MHICGEILEFVNSWATIKKEYIKRMRLLILCKSLFIINFIRQMFQLKIRSHKPNSIKTIVLTRSLHDKIISISGPTYRE